MLRQLVHGNTIIFSLMKYQLFILSFLLCSLLGVSQAQQSNSRINAANSASNRQPDDDENERLGSPQQEFIHRSAIARLEAEHKKNAERAHECAALSIEIEKAFQGRQALDSAFTKKLERLEKLTRRIRSYAGGSDNEDVGGEMPPDLEASTTRLREISERLRQEVDRTPRRVVSAKIISTTNELLTLVRRVRTFVKP